MLNILVVAMETSEFISYVKYSVLLLVSHFHLKNLPSITSPQVPWVAFRWFTWHLLNTVHSLGLPKLISHKICFLNYYCKGLYFYFIVKLVGYLQHSPKWSVIIDHISNDLLCKLIKEKDHHA